MTETPDLVLRISLAKEVFHPEEPISVTIVARNVTTVPLTITRDFQPRSLSIGGTIRCVLTREDQRVPGPDIRYYRLRQQDLAVLGPEEERRYIIKDLDWCATKSYMGPGNYRLFLTYDTYVGDHLRDTGIWIGFVYSNEVTFTISGD